MKNRHDHYYKKAKEEKYAARSVYKLEEAQKKYNFLKASDNILDIGCSPGSWSQYMLTKIIKSGQIVGVDILPVSFSHPNFKFIQKDVRDLTKEDTENIMFDSVVSDAMPNTTSDKETNHLRSISLAEIIFRFAKPHIKKGGSFFIKVYDGRDFPSYRKMLSENFEFVDVFKPKSSRNESRELFIFSRGSF